LLSGEAGGSRRKESGREIVVLGIGLRVLNNDVIDT